MPKRKISHLHKYERRTLGNNGYKIYHCSLPGCSHYINVKLALGKLCVCNRCSEPMIMTRNAITLAKPHHDECIRRKSDTVKKLETLFKNA